MQQLLLVLVSGLLAGGFALLGVVLGPWIKARSDQEQWRRERQLDACAELYQAVFELLVAIAWPSRPPGKDGQLGTEQAHLRMRDVLRAESRVRLVAPKAVRKASHELGSKLAKILDGHPGITRDNEDELASEVRRLHEAFAEAARRSLGVR